MSGLSLEPIGFVENSFESPVRDPKVFEGSLSKIRVLEKYAEGLEGLEEFSRVCVLFIFHQSQGFSLKVHPRGDTSREEKGVFATRSPSRPNSIGLSIVELVSITGNLLLVRNLDAIDGSPVVDIKPWKEDFP